MDYASAIPAPGMTTRSLRPLLEGKAAAVSQYRQFVSTGLGNWRLVVKDIGGKQYVLIFLPLSGEARFARGVMEQHRRRMGGRGGSRVWLIIDIGC
jgi:hypothetical protein